MLFIFRETDLTYNVYLEHRIAEEFQTTRISIDKYNSREYFD